MPTPQLALRRVSDGVQVVGFVVGFEVRGVLVLVVGFEVRVGLVVAFVVGVGFAVAFTPAPSLP